MSKGVCIVKKHISFIVGGIFSSIIGIIVIFGWSNVKIEYRMWRLSSIEKFETQTTCLRNALSEIRSLARESGYSDLTYAYTPEWGTHQRRGRACAKKVQTMCWVAFQAHEELNLQYEGFTPANIERKKKTVIDFLDDTNCHYFEQYYLRGDRPSNRLQQAWAFMRVTGRLERKVRKIW